MNDLLLNKQTSIEIDNFLAKPAHALIIEGKVGAGKSTLAQHLAAKLLDTTTQALEYYPYVLKVKPTAHTVTIDSIREAQKFLKLKTTGQARIRRVLMVEQAEKMTVEAQNAFLKILEEPPTDTVILILTAHKVKLLPTIRSRTQSLSIKALTKQQIEEYFASEGHSQATITSAYYAGNAQVGAISDLLAADDNPKLHQMQIVKKVLGMSRFDRLVFADELIKQKNDLNGFAEALTTVCQAALKQTVAKEDYRGAKRWQHSLKLALQAQASLNNNPNPKLLLTDLLINL